MKKYIEPKSELIEVNTENNLLDMSRGGNTLDNGITEASAKEDDIYYFGW
ncbi:MAG: hypothetical protein Q4F34_02635 [Prevotellaceae bacterium]|nr:hypothetical protein [Prevotellaceae bacterium]